MYRSCVCAGPWLTGSSCANACGQGCRSRLCPGAWPTRSSCANARAVPTATASVRSSLADPVQLRERSVRVPDCPIQRCVATRSLAWPRSSRANACRYRRRPRLCARAWPTRSSCANARRYRRRPRLSVRAWLARSSCANARPAPTSTAFERWNPAHQRSLRERARPAPTSTAFGRWSLARPVQVRERGSASPPRRVSGASGRRGGGAGRGARRPGPRRVARRSPSASRACCTRWPCRRSRPRPSTAGRTG